MSKPIGYVQCSHCKRTAQSPLEAQEAGWAQWDEGGEDRCVARMWHCNECQPDLFQVAS